MIGLVISCSLFYSGTDHVIVMVILPSTTCQKSPILWLKTVLNGCRTKINRKTNSASISTSFNHWLERISLVVGRQIKEGFRVRRERKIQEILTLYPSLMAPETSNAQETEFCKFIFLFFCFEIYKFWFLPGCLDVSQITSDLHHVPN